MIPAIQALAAIKSAAAVVYAVWSSVSKSPDITLSGGNLTASIGVFGAYRSGAANMSKAAGKWYWEIHIDALGAAIQVGAGSLGSFAGAAGADANGCVYEITTGKILNNDTTLTTVATSTTGDTIGVAIDVGTNIKIYKNNTLLATISTSVHLAPVVSLNSSDQVTANFGATAFTYTPPAGYNAGLY